MPTEAPSSGLFWVGWILTILVTAFLIFDGATKVLRITPVVEACLKVGLRSETIAAIGATLLAVAALYVVPRTAGVGIILLTAYLGGAVATHVRAGSSVFETVFPIGFCGLAWLGIVLRDPRLMLAILLRH